jgi:hypothetical protein
MDERQNRKNSEDLFWERIINQKDEDKKIRLLEWHRREQSLRQKDVKAKRWKPSWNREINAKER